MEKVFNKKETIYFDEEKVIHNLKHYLPSQPPLKDFVHHNTLHAFDNYNFFDGIFKASKMFGYKVTLRLDEYRELYNIGRIKKEILDKILIKEKGKEKYDLWFNNLLKKQYNYSCFAERIFKLRNNWKKYYKINLDDLVQPLLFRIINSYLDQGIAIWHFPFENKGLINAIKLLEEKSFSSFFKTKRAKKLLFTQDLSIKKLLEILVYDEKLFENYLFDQQFSHKGWSGIISVIEDKPETILYDKHISLKDFIILELLLEIDTLDYEFGENNWKPLGKVIDNFKVELFDDLEKEEIHEVLRLWQIAYEWTYYDEILATLKKVSNYTLENNIKKFQAVFCIDERECSIRRHLEHIEPNCETFGAPGFFGVEFFFRPAGGKFYEKLCPVPVTPNYLIKEKVTINKKHKDIFYSKKTHSLIGGFLTSLSVGLFVGFKLLSELLSPRLNSTVSYSFSHAKKDTELLIENKNTKDIENNLQIGFTLEEMAIRVENLLKGIGLTENFSDIVYIVSHGSSSANNPHHGAHECGACSGRPGGINARVFSFMANHKEVRKILSKKGINIPENTQFIGAMHDTCRDEIVFYDEDKVSIQNLEKHNENKNIFEKALSFNAKERARRFPLFRRTEDEEIIKQEMRKRSASYFDPRPELGHCTNSLCFIAHRNLTKDLFLDRRAFLNSYNYRNDRNGEVLFNVLKPLPLVCGGINLEYYFSRIDNAKLGAGTKLPHNIMGLIGVANSTDGDLRTGLPIQMLEAHEPIRLLMIIEHHPNIVLNVIKKDSSVYNWFKNNWINLSVINPEDKNIYVFDYNNEVFEIYNPVSEKTLKTSNMYQLINKKSVMFEPSAVNTVEENIPVHIIERGNK
ncbi:MAG: hypothetical protein KatS3mg068_1796 [Candidatus Sericytochromatia bacterium]|nr:MAG: hypothetical protein KatS3mg068_1796 [Candidatus Sericytochromatia bacterium]